MIRYPDKFLDVPLFLRGVSNPATKAEIDEANSIRAEYIIPGESAPYMEDVVRAFRIALGASIYIEVGTQDKGNIACLARTKLAPGAIIIDIDMLEYPENDMKIADELIKSGFRYHSIRGDCLSDYTISQVNSILDGRRADLIFCDSHYTYEHTMREFAQYYPLLRRGGHLLFHDALWPGDESADPSSEFYKIGKRFGVEQIDRLYPTYMVYGPDAPLYRYVPPITRHKFWGALAIIPS